ncbi:YibE/F family protein [Desulfitobacterium chlororespirans]|uniref:Uncharacterized membrane protein n=1 Tax=Desulfitobacterium chlororespirans DSM 11544 TaxID=1121395 RepID=A0A1M7SM57_9FIRM|nr:YibE/F family protein [Desulfitobacterium chlororespirans]SHN59508.1 Uncharacterized membrane protein [Desulfitobacterium chlororespirans DSM 11544]
MKKNLYKYIVLGVICIAFSFISSSHICLAAAEISSSSSEKQEKMIRARIISIDLQKHQNSAQSVELITLEGAHKQQRFVTSFYATGIFYGITLRENDEVFVTLFLNGDGAVEKVSITEIARDKYMTYLLLGFIGLLVLIGGAKGIRAILSLLATYFAIIYVLFPLILQGYDPTYITIGLCSVIAIFTLLLVGGHNKKTFAAIIGTLCGLCAAAYLTITIGDLAHFTGAIDEDSYLLEYLSQDSIFSYQGLFFAGIIIGSLGAVMDVSMSIASAVNELKEKTYSLSSCQLIKAGMNVGKDTIGTMANTLILAYTGGSIYMLLLLSAENISLHQLINREIIASEILRSMAGSIGLTITVPITAIVAGLLFQRQHP